MRNSQPAYRAFLLRLWRTGPEGPWRASVEGVESGEVTGFGSIQELCRYLLRIAGTHEVTRTGPTGPRPKPRAR